MQTDTTVVNVKTAPYDLYIGRANATYGLAQSKWHNPFKLEREQDRAIVLARYRIWLLNQPALMRDLHELRGLRLACWCSPKACHGDVLAELANSAAAQTPARIAPWALDTASDLRAYWAIEVELGSAALERLARICRQQNYDYAATVEALR